MVRGRRKRILVWAGLLLGLVLLAIAALPLWLPWVLRPILSSYGVSYVSSERLSYSRLALRQVTWTNRNVQVRAELIEAPTPTAWLLQFAKGPDQGDFIILRDWRLNIEPGQSRRRRPSAAYTQFREIDDAVAEFRKWLPAAALTNGVILFRNQTVKIGHATLRDSVITADARAFGLADSVTVRATTAREGHWKISARYLPLAASALVEAGLTTTNLLVTGTALLGTNEITLAADFAADGLLPRSASIDAPQFVLRRDLLGGELFDVVSGTAHARWADPAFEIDIKGRGTFETNWPPLEFALRAHGSTNWAELSQFSITGPGINAALSGPVRVPFGAVEPMATLTFSSDLGRGPWTNLTGTVQGQALFAPGTNRLPRVEFSFVGTNVGRKSFRIPSVTGNGALLWPRVELRDSTVNFVRTDATPAGSSSAGRDAAPSASAAPGKDPAPPASLSLRGHADLKQKTIGHAEATGTCVPMEIFLLTNVPVRFVSGRIVAQGPFTNINYTAAFTGETMSNRWFNPARVAASVRGRGRDVGEATLTAAVGDSTLRGRFSASLGDLTNQFVLKQLEFTNAGTAVLRLVTPATLTAQKAGESAPLRLQMPSLRLAGTDSTLAFSLEAAWPARGAAQLEVRNTHLRSFSDFLAADLHSLEINSARLNTRWDDGPLLGFASLDGNYTVAEPFHGTCEVAVSPEGLVITNLLVWSESAPVIHARGLLPLRVEPARREPFTAVPDRSIDLTFGTEPDPTFWARLGNLTGLHFLEPQISGRIHGPWTAPTGQVSAAIAKIGIPRKDRSLPAISDVRLVAEFERRVVRVTSLSGRIEDQPLRCDGELPLRETTTLGNLIDWGAARVRFEIASASLAPFARYLPTLLAPVGTLNAEIALTRGELDGYLTITNAATQPLGNFGALREIDAQFTFDDRTILLQEARARLAGEPLLGSGFMHLGTNWNTLPPFHLNLWGTNIAMVRQPQIIIRADLDLALIHADTNPPIVSGTAVLRDSFYLSDLESLIPGSVAHPERRPPYFSIEADPLSAWRLNLNVVGADFMKVRTPFLRGTVSSNVRLRGTLREPIATGDARVTSGYVEFPFGTLSIKQGVISLTPEQPFSPQLYLAARSRRFGYDVTLEVTGSAKDPVLQFTSVPPLPSEKIFLMLTAGELPRDEISFTPTQKAQRFAVFIGSKVLNSLGFVGTSERLSFRTGEDISETGTQTYDMEYKLTDKWSIVGQYDRFNAFNLSLKRQIYSK